MLAQDITNVLALCGLEKASIEEYADSLLRIVNKRGLKGPIFVCFDLNGPLVPVDASLKPYKGVRECIELLYDLPGVMPAIVTGWDISSVKAFAMRELGKPGITIISEKGMVASVNGQERHIYPFKLKEITSFAEAVLRIASTIGIQLCVQPNASSGCQCVFIEGFSKACIQQHPLVTDFRNGPEMLANVFNKTKIPFQVRGDEVSINASACELYNLLRFQLPLVPVRLSGYSFNWSIKVDPVDDPFFGWSDFQRIAEEIATNTSRIANLNQDFNADFLTREAIEGSYTKNTTARRIGSETFGDSFILQKADIFCKWNI